MITVVMLNWARPTYALSNLHRYALYRLVKQVLCFNNGPRLIHERKLPRKCVLVETSRDLGLYSRFAAASLATTEAIFHTDDDLVVPEHTLEALYDYWLGARLSCHGLYGRMAYPFYQFGDIFGPVEVVLTRAVVCSQRVNNLALAASHLFDDLNAQPRGNGEDIILSFAGMYSSRGPNFAYKLPAENYPSDNNTEIHQRWPNHLQHRQQVVNRCRTVFFGQMPKGSFLRYGHTG
jgi:hypothetical protein